MAQFVGAKVNSYLSLIAEDDDGADMLKVWIIDFEGGQSVH